MQITQRYRDGYLQTSENRQRGVENTATQNDDSPTRPYTNPHLVNEAKTPLVGAAFLAEKETGNETKEYDKKGCSS